MNEEFTTSEKVAQFFAGVGVVLGGYIIIRMGPVAVVRAVAPKFGKWVAKQYVQGAVAEHVVGKVPVLEIPAQYTTKAVIASALTTALYLFDPITIIKEEVELKAPAFLPHYFGPEYPFQVNGYVAEVYESMVSIGGAIAAAVGRGWRVDP